MIEKLRLGKRAAVGAVVLGAILFGVVGQQAHRAGADSTIGRVDQRLTHGQRGQPGDVHRDDHDRRDNRPDRLLHRERWWRQRLLRASREPHDRGFPGRNRRRRLPGCFAAVILRHAHRHGRDGRHDVRHDAGDRTARQHRPAVVGRLDRQCHRRGHRGQPRDLPGDDLTGRRRWRSTSPTTAGAGGVSGSFHVNKGDTSMQISVGTVGNGTPEDDRNFTVTLTGTTRRTGRLGQRHPGAPERSSTTTGRSRSPRSTRRR